MAPHGLLALLCAGTIGLSDPPAARPTLAPELADSAVATSLAVQTAMQQGRDHMLRGDYRAAVVALEGQLAFINGHAAYLKLLQNAYRGYIQELRLAKQDAEAQRYLKRLLILDRGALLDQTPAAPKAAVAKAAPPPAKPPVPTIRLKSDDDPFAAARRRDAAGRDTSAVLSQAEQLFGKHDYREACALYEQANQVDPRATETSRERWAYCKLYCVVEQLNQSGGTPAWAELEKEVRAALELAPRLDYGRVLLEEIHKRRDQAPAAPTAAPTRGEGRVAVRHAGPGADGWYVAETTNFRVFYRQSQDFAEQAAQVAEKTRADMQLKWFGAVTDGWSPKCDLFLHPTGQDYARATGQQNSPGHSTLRLEGGRVVVRRIDLHCDDPNLLGAVLPHETTHVVLAGEFGDQLVPRWADEGMAVLTEPREKVDRHLANLVKCYHEGGLFRLQDLMQLADYPQDARHIGVFYAQSVALVDFLCRLKGPQEFSLFMHSGMRYGYAKALERHYGFRNFAELEQRWSESALREQPGQLRVAGRQR